MADRYDAFISYSRAADGHLAPALQTALQRLAKPWSKRRALEVFRDETGLAVTPDLWGAITDALDNADWFVLLASPQAAESRWVNQEIERWIENDPAGSKRILPVLTSGRLAWDLDANDWTADSDAAPAALHGIYENEPRYIDLSWVDDPDDIDLRNARFRQVVAEIAAPMHGMSQDDLIGEDVQRHRAATRLRVAAVTALVLLTATAVVAAVLGFRSEDRAQRNEADATAREFAARSASLLDDDPEMATLWAIESVVGIDGSPSKPTRRPEADDALRAALTQLITADTHPVGVPIDVRAMTIEISPDGEQLAALDLDGRLSVWTTAGEPVADLPGVTEAFDISIYRRAPAPELSFSPDGTQLLLSMTDGSEMYTLDGLSALPPTIIDPATGELAPLEAVGPAAWLPDGAVVAMAPEAGNVLRWTRPGQPDQVVSKIATFDAEGPDALVVTRSGTVAAIWPDRLIDIDPAAPSSEPIAQIDLLPLAREDRHGIAASNPVDEAVHLFVRRSSPVPDAIRPLFELARIDLDESDVTPLRPSVGPVAAGALAISPDGAFAASIDGESQQGLSGSQSGVLRPGRFVTITALTSSNRAEALSIATNDATDVAWFPDGRRLAIASANGIRIHRVSASPYADGALAIAVDGDRSEIAIWSATSSGSVRTAGSTEPTNEFTAGYIEGDAEITEPEQGVLAFGAEADSVVLAGLARPNQNDTVLLDDGVVTDAPGDWTAPIAASTRGDRIVDGIGQVIELGTGSAVGQLDLGTSSVVDYRWVDDDSLIIALTADGSVVAHSSTGDDSFELATGLRSPTSLGIDANATTIVVGDARGRLRIIDWSTLDVRTISLAHNRAVTSVDLSADGSLVYSAGGNLAVHEVATRTERWSSNDIPTVADTVDWWLVTVLADGSAIAASQSRVVTIPSTDLAVACAAVSDDAIRRFETEFGRASACDELREPTLPSRPYPSLDRPPVITAATTTLVPPAMNEVGDSIDVLLPDDETIATTCQSFADRATLPLSRNDRGLLVAQAQQLLLDRGAAIDVDGCFGPRTVEVVQFFQAEQGLEATGTIDQATWDLLDSV